MYHLVKCFQYKTFLDQVSLLSIFNRSTDNSVKAIYKISVFNSPQSKSLYRLKSFIKIKYSNSCTL